MTIVRSLGITTLVALMSAHRAVAQQCDAEPKPFDQAAVKAIEEADLRRTDDPPRRVSTAPPPSYN
jgi:hypothetical protein